MLLRRIAPAVLALTGLAACEPEVGYKPGANTQTIDYAVFDLSASPPQIPQPNDLALAQAASIPGAQGELLRVFARNRLNPYRFHAEGRVARGNAF